MGGVQLSDFVDDEVRVRAVAQQAAAKSEDEFAKRWVNIEKPWRAARRRGEQE